MAYLTSGGGTIDDLRRVLLTDRSDLRPSTGGTLVPRAATFDGYGELRGFPNGKLSRSAVPNLTRCGPGRRHQHWWPHPAEKTWNAVGGFMVYQSLLAGRRADRRWPCIDAGSLRSSFFSARRSCCASSFVIWPGPGAAACAQGSRLGLRLFALAAGLGKVSCR
jgi:hypothetical protein